MALVNTIGNNYSPDEGGFAEGIRNLGMILAQQPAMRARAAQVQAQAQESGALAGEATARGHLYQSQADREQIANAGLKQIGDLANKGLLRSDDEGNLIVDSKLASQVLGGVLQQSKGADDAGGGLAKALGAFNAPVQAGLNRKAKMDVATAADDTKEGISAAQIASKEKIAEKSNLVKQLMAFKPPGGMQDYTQTTVRDEKNPDRIVNGVVNTNAPAFVPVTNRVSRVVGQRPQAQPSSPASAVSPRNQTQSNLIPVPDDVSADVAGAIQRGNDAISKGADPAAVKARLKKLYGYDL